MLTVEQRNTECKSIEIGVKVVAGEPSWSHICVCERRVSTIGDEFLTGYNGDYLCHVYIIFVISRLGYMISMKIQDLKFNSRWILRWNITLNLSIICLNLFIIYCFCIFHTLFPNIFCLFLFDEAGDSFFFWREQLLSFFFFFW